MPAFADSVDLTENYEIGACGEKVVTLDSLTPPFITLAKDVIDPILNELTITYTEALATISDVETTHTVSYTVTSKEYGSHISSHSDTFTLRIVCPDYVLNSESSMPSVSLVYDIPARTPLPLVWPVVTLTPNPCFTVSSFKAYDA